MAKSSPRRVTIYINGKEEDASGWQTFSYGKLGELTENIRTFALPFENRTYTFKMQYAYDSYNRIQNMTYPDGEVVRYGYNRGGMLRKVHGAVTRQHHDQTAPAQIQSFHQPDGVQWNPGDIIPPDPPPTPPEPIYDTFPRYYIDSIAYNIFELRQAVFYGNGTRAYYTYDSLQRLQTLRSLTAQDSLMQDIHYTYDSVGNITHISNSAGGVSGLGGRYEGHYTYDNLYRLVAANGYWINSRDSLPFSESMNYTANGRILKKTVYARILNGNHSTTKSSDFRYSYSGHGNQVSTITDNGTFPVVTQSFLWDDCGNVDRWAMLSKTGTQWLRTHTWTEDNRLQTVADNNWFSYYQYDAGGERTYKLTWAGSTSNRSGDRSIYYTPDEATLYASPYLVITPQGYTKHYYAESERITSQLGKGQFADVGTSVVSDSLVQVKLQAVTGNVEYPATLTVPGSGTFAYLDTLTNQQNATSTLYFYHPDHLGSSSWITTTNGTVKQHLHYLPWGEDFVNQRSSHFDGVRYTFSAKEKDTETGYSYFGARYYSSDLSIWLSVDPMADKYPSLSPYTYCANNPIMLFDPNGQKSWPIASKHQNGDRCIISGVRRNSNGAKHGGVDIVHRTPKGNLRGGTITATHNGKVTASGFSKSAGNWIQITNGDIRTSYMHMEGAPKQKVGEWIFENDVVGKVGSTGHSYGPHIHYQIELYNQETGLWEKINPVMEGYEKVTHDMDVHLMDPQIYINNRDELDGFSYIKPTHLDEVIIQDNNKANDVKNEINSL